MNCETCKQPAHPTAYCPVADEAICTKDAKLENGIVLRVKPAETQVWYIPPQASAQQTLMPQPKPAKPAGAKRRAYWASQNNDPASKLRWAAKKVRELRAQKDASGIVKIVAWVERNVPVGAFGVAAFQETAAEAVRYCLQK